MSVIRYYHTTTPGGRPAYLLQPEWLRVWTVAEFRAQLHHIPTLDKNTVGAYVPAEFPTVPCRRQIANVGGSGASVWLDIDVCPTDTWAKALEWLAAFEGEAWTTHSSGRKVPGTVSARVRVTVDRDHTHGQETRHSRQGFAARLFEATGCVADPALFQPVAIFYCPAVHPDCVGSERVWLFDGSVKPTVDDLAAEGVGSARSALVDSGRITLRAVNAPATEADVAEANRQLGRWVSRLESGADGAKRLLYVVGCKVAASARVGALDLDAAVQVIEAALETGRPGHGGEYLPHFQNGLAVMDAEPIRDYDAVVEVAEDESKTEARIQADLAKALTGDLLPLDVLRARLPVLLREESKFGGGVVVLRVDAGVGKTHAIINLLNERVPAGVPTVVAVPTHAIAAEITAKLTPEAAAKTVHLHNPLLTVPGSPECGLPPAERERKKLQVFQQGRSQYKVCGECRFSATCSAKSNWISKSRRAKSEGNSVIVSQEGVGQVAARFDDPPARPLLIVDEQFPPFVSAEYREGDLELARQHPLTDMQTWCAAVERGWGWPSDEFAIEVTEGAPAATVAIEEAALRIVAFVVAARTPGAKVTSRRVDVPHPVRALLAGGGVLTTATANLDLLQGAKVVNLVAPTSPKHHRVIYPLSHSGIGHLRPTDPDAIRRAQEGLDWVSAKAGAGRGLFVSYKGLVQAMVASGAVPANVDVGWFWGVRGRNDWRGCNAVLVLGAPWGRSVDEGRLVGGDAWAYGRNRAADELRQCVERVRSVSRPDAELWMAVRGSVAPTGWTAADTTIGTWGDPEDALAALNRALDRMSANALADALGVRKEQVSTWRSGKKAMSDKHHAALLEILNAPVVGLFG